MSIVTEITRLQNAKESIKTSIENKGVTVSSSAKLEDYADLIDDIPTGGGTEGLWCGGNNPVLIKKYENILNLSNDTTYDSKSISSSAQTIKNSETLFSSEVDLKNYDYVVIIRTLYNIEYKTGSTISGYKYQKKKLYNNVFNIGKSYSSLSSKFDSAHPSMQQHCSLYNNGSSGETYMSSSFSGGIGQSGIATPQLSSNNTILNVKSSTMTIQASSSYMQGEAFNYVDSSNSQIIIKAELYRVDKSPYTEMNDYNVTSLIQGYLN